ncbi:hypothetical protein [Burkholderia vietnamiensis]|uniref:hypothetical protein n=1 Tax=Burkholderia vietnamiensis TaxID=60552 RepID=UPI0030C8C4F3
MMRAASIEGGDAASANLQNLTLAEPDGTVRCGRRVRHVAWHSRTTAKKTAGALTIFIYVKRDRHWRNRGEECHVRHAALQCTLAAANRASVELRDFTDTWASPI